MRSAGGSSPSRSRDRAHALESEVDGAWVQILLIGQPLGQRAPGGHRESPLALSGCERGPLLQQAQQYGKPIAHGAPIDDQVQGPMVEQEFAALKSLGQASRAPFAG